MVLLKKEEEELRNNKYIRRYNIHTYIPTCVSMRIGTKIMKCLTVPTCCSSSNCPETDLKKAVGRTTEYFSRPCEVSAAFESASSNANLETHIQHTYIQAMNGCSYL